MLSPRSAITGVRRYLGKDIQGEGFTMVGKNTKNPNAIPIGFGNNLPVPVPNLPATINSPAVTSNLPALRGFGKAPVWGAGIGAGVGGYDAYQNDENVLYGAVWGGIKGAAVGGAIGGLRRGAPIDRYLGANRYTSRAHTGARQTISKPLQAIMKNNTTSRTANAVTKTGRVAKQNPPVDYLENWSINGGLG